MEAANLDPLKLRGSEKEANLEILCIEMFEMFERGRNIIFFAQGGAKLKGRKLEVAEIDTNKVNNNNNHDRFSEIEENVESIHKYV